MSDLIEQRDKMRKAIMQALGLAPALITSGLTITNQIETQSFPPRLPPDRSFRVEWQELRRDSRGRAVVADDVPETVKRAAIVTVLAVEP
jgi:hypothetical protein